MQQFGSMMLMLSLLAVVWVCVRRIAAAGGEELRFEEEAAPELMGLGLYRDGVMALETNHAPQPNNHDE